MRDIATLSRRRFLEKQVGSEIEVLVEKLADGRAIGTARDGTHARVDLCSDEVPAGDLLRAVVRDVDGEVLVGGQAGDDGRSPGVLPLEQRYEKGE